MATMKIDQLNSPTEQVVESRNIIPIDEYFDDMYLTESEKEERKDLAKNLYVILSAILTIIKANEVLKNPHDTEYYKDYIASNLEILFDNVFGSGSYRSLIESFANEFIDSTMRHIDTPYFTSDDRAIVNAEQQSNAVYNQKQYEDAIASGKTRKTWVTMHDKRVRASHDAADGQEVEINKPFEIGSSELLFPGDLSLGANLKEICNCRCVVVYSGSKNEITRDEENAIGRYVGGESYTLNEKLRNNEPLTEDEEKLQNMLDSALRKTPTYSGTLYREITVPENNLPDFLKDYVEGNEITFNAYTSTSKQKDLYDKDGNVKYTILDTHKAHDISSFNTKEIEVLYERKQSFYVLGNDYIDNTYHILLMEK